MHLDPRPQLPDPGSDLQDLEADRVELGPRPRGTLKMTSPQGVFSPGALRPLVSIMPEFLALQPRQPLPGIVELGKAGVGSILLSQ